MTIGRKFTVWTISLLLVIGGLSAGLFYHLQMSQERQRLSTFGAIVGRAVESGLDHYMMTRDSRLLDKNFRDLGAIRGISRILLINKKGIVTAASGAAETGRFLSRKTPGCAGCHEKGQSGLYMKREKTLRWVQPIANRAECHSCHDPGVRVNGVLVIDFSLEEWENQVESQILTGFLIFIPSLAIIGISLLALSKALVINRLNSLIAMVRMVREGDYDFPVLTGGNDEITSLQENFSEMAAAVRDREREKDILFGQISRSQRMWEETFDSIGDLISIHDTDFNIVKVNRAFRTYFDLDPNAVIHKKCFEFFHASDAPPETCPHAATMRLGCAVTEEMLSGAGGRIFRISTFPFTLPDAGFQGTIHVAKDITEDREKEMRLIMGERLASLGQMASGIAHEINNPLAAIAGCAEGLLNRVNKGSFDPAIFQDYLNIIVEEIGRCKNITTGMLSLVRQQTYENRDLDVHETIDRSIEIIGFQGRLKNVGVIRRYAKTLPLVRASRGDLTQIFLAIITNALDAMEEKGTLTIETTIEGGRAKIAFCDTGPGISAEHLKHIFTPFFTTKADRGGTGLGLPIAAKIAAGLNGAIHVSSEQGSGTVFSLFLPATS